MSNTSGPGLPEISVMEGDESWGAEADDERKLRRRSYVSHLVMAGVGFGLLGYTFVRATGAVPYPAPGALGVVITIVVNGFVCAWWARILARGIRATVRRSGPARGLIGVLPFPLAPESMPTARATIDWLPDGPVTVRWPDGSALRLRRMEPPDAEG